MTPPRWSTTAAATAGSPEQMTDVHPAGRPPARRRALWVLVGLVVLLGTAYAGAYTLAGAGVARGTTVLGVGIGGQSRAEAVRTLERELADEQATPVPVRAGDVEGTVPTEGAGLSVDVRATVDTAQARSWNPVELVDALFGSDDVAPVVTVDEPALRAALDSFAASLDAEAVDGAVSYEGTDVVRVEPRQGIVLDRPGSVDAVAAAYLGRRHLGSGPAVRLPAQVTEPAVGAAAVEQAATGVAQPAVAAPVTVTVEGTDIVLRPRDIARSLTFVPAADGSLEPRLDGERLRRSAAEALTEVEQPATNASFDVSSGRPRVVKAKQGRAVLPETLATAVLPVLPTPGPRAVEVPLQTSEPDVTTAEARELGVTGLVADFTTYYPSDFAPRLTNIHRAADLMDDTLVLPGETFSFNGTVGERTAARGFAAGFVISGGQIEVDFGGGVSQLVTTTFNAAYFAGLEIVEHNPHSFYISRYPEGRESTVAWGVKDLKVRNDGDTAVFITTSYTNSSVTVRVWGTKRYRIETFKGPRYDIQPFRVVYDPRPQGTGQGDCVPTAGVSGFKVVVTRTFYQGDRKIRSEDFRTTYNPEPEVRCGASGPPPAPPVDEDDEPA